MHGSLKFGGAAGHAATHAPAPLDAAAAVAIEVRRLSKRLGGAAVLRDVSFSIGCGEAVALIGANGAGKSTCMRSCVRLIEPDGGTVRIGGQDVTGLGAAALRQARQRIGFVFQKHNLSPRMDVLSNVVHGALGRLPRPLAWSHRLAPGAVRAEAMQCLGKVGLAALAGRRCDRLSGGQSQRAAIARALMQRPRVILADEPVASLDPASAEEVMALFVSLIREGKATLLFSSHHLDHARRHADRIIALRSGEVVFDGPPDQLGRCELEQIYGATGAH